MVDAAVVCISRAFRFHRLFELGRISGGSLLARSERRRLSFAVLFPRNFRQLAARYFWRKTRLVAGMAVFLPGPSGTMGAGRLSAYLLLLPWCLLQSVLGRSAGLRRRRTTEGISGRSLFPADHAEHSPLFPLPRVAVHRCPRTRRVEGDVVQRSFGLQAFRDRRWDDRPDGQCLSVGQLHVRVSFPSTFGRRFPG